MLLIFLPPLLYSGAFFADLNALRHDTRVISLLSIGLVLATALVVGAVAHFAFDLPWAVSIALGAIVGPTDPVAATTILRRLGIPRRIVNVLEGESLVNDASALVIYKVAVAAAIGGSFSVAEAGLRFLLAVVGGLAIGLLVGYLLAAIRRRVEDPTTEITISLFSGYAAFLPADQIGASGVLAAVTCGVYIGWRAPELVSPTTRLQSIPIWEVLVFLLNATLFIPHRAAAAGDRRRPQRRWDRRRDCDRRRRPGDGTGDPHPPGLELRRHRAHPRGRPAAQAARAASQLEAARGRRLVGDARRRL